MSDKQRKITLFAKFGLKPDDLVNNYTIEWIQRRMSIPDLQSYLEEIRNTMLSKIDNYPQITKLNREDATSFLLLMASNNDKYNAICKALNLWEF